MKLPVMPPVSPMLAKTSATLPTGGQMLYEPKWDGFRTIVFRDRDEVELGSRNERPLTRYFPELASPIRASLPDRCVVDGEIIIVGEGTLDFDALLQRIHPAESRIRRLAGETPASFVAFDILASGESDLRREPLAERRHLLERGLGRAEPPVYLTPATTDRELAGEWFERFEGAGLDGVVAKGLGSAYLEGERTMVKVKHVRTADCVVGGFRWHKQGGVVGSLLLGLFDDRGVLHHVGVTSSFNMARRRELVNELQPYRLAEGTRHPWGDGVGGDGGGGETGVGDGGSPEATTGRRPGGQSRWTANRDLSWQPLAPQLVCEVAYGQLQGDRFRHAVTFKRWRPDREAASCTYSQLEVPAEYDFERLADEAKARRS